MTNLASKTKSLFVTYARLWTKVDLDFKAAGLTYYALVAIVPLLLLLIILSGLLINQDFIAIQVNGYIEQIFSPAITARLQEFINSLTNSDYSLELSIGGLIALLYGTTTYFSKLNLVVHQFITGIDDDELGLYFNVKRRLTALLYSFFIFIFIAIISLLRLLTSNVEVIFEIVGTSNESIALLIDWGSVIISLGLLVLLFVLFYKTIARREVSYQASIWTSLAVTVAMLVLNRVFAIALEFSANFRDYGIFSAVLAVILWIHITNMLLLSGALLIREIDTRTSVRLDKTSQIAD